MEESLRILLHALVHELFNIVDITGVAIIVTQMFLKGLESQIHNVDEDIEDLSEYWIEDEIITWCYEISKDESKDGIGDCKGCMALIEYKDFINRGGHDENNNSMVKLRNNQSWNSYVNNSSLLYNVSWIGFFNQDLERDTKISYRIETTRQDLYKVVTQNGNHKVYTKKEDKEVNNKHHNEEVVAEDIYIWDYEDYDLVYEEQNQEESAVNIFSDYQDVMEFVLNQEEKESGRDLKNKQREEEEQYHYNEEKEVELIIREIRKTIQNHLEHNAKYTLYKDNKQDFVNQSVNEDKKNEKQNECEYIIQSKENKTKECKIQNKENKVEEHVVHEHKDETKDGEICNTSSSKVIKEEIMPVFDTRFTVGEPEPLDININYIERKSKSVYLQIPFTSNFKNRSLTECKTENTSEQIDRKFKNGCTHLKAQKHCKVANCRDSVFQQKSELKRISLTTIRIQDLKNEQKDTKNALSGKGRHRNNVVEANSNVKQNRDFHVQFSPKLGHKHTVPKPFHFDNHNKENLPNHGPFIPELKHQHTMPKPFELIEKHDCELQARKQAKLHALMEEEQKKLEFESVKCRPAPHFGTPFKPKLSHKCTQPKPFVFLERPSKTDKRIKSSKRSTAR